MPSRRTAPWLLITVLALAATGCAHKSAAPTTQPPPAGVTPGAPDTAPAPAPAVAAPTPPKAPTAVAWAAQATTNVTAWFAPDGKRVLGVFPAKQPSGDRTVFLLDQPSGAAGASARARGWLRVRLPRRPNGSTGWIKGSQVRLEPLQRRVDVDLSVRQLTMYQLDRVVRRWSVAVGQPSTPTPTGHFYITIKLKPPAISHVYGAWALGLSGFSNVLDQFGTGDGQIALHGTANAGSLGGAVSHGCVRMDNGAISALAESLPLGTPVTIHA
jgi:lipoprotein-anchoring transpeptidase ErfK/SrfK